MCHLNASAVFVLFYLVKYLFMLCLTFFYKTKHISLTQAVTDPQKSVPSITAIGFHGVQVWQNGMLFIFKLETLFQSGI
jgi:hypothetical protein